MAESKFGVKEIDLIDSSGTPEISSPNNLTLTAVQVGVSTDLDVGRNVSIASTVSIGGTVSAGEFNTGTTKGDGTDRSYGIRYYITSNGTSGYNFAGPGVLSSVDNPTIYLQRGLTYIFINSTTSSHPFAIRYSSQGTGYGSTYLSGNQQGTQIFTVPFDAPSSLVYQCTIHSGMVGTITIPS